MQHKWLSKLLGYCFTLNFADALSRVQLSEPRPTWIEFVEEDYKRSEKLQQLRQQFEEGKLDSTLYTDLAGMIFL